MKNKNLAKPPQYSRFSGAKGIKSESPIARKGGDYGAGLIRQFAVITRGEALGHDFWVDRTFLHQVAEAINASEAGRKSRFTHPGLSSDGLGKFLGRTKNAIVDGDTVRADQHFAKSAHRTPDGDLAGYLMDRAAEDPETFGASIVFEHDWDAEDAFMLSNGGDSKGEGFVSPDPLNTRNLPHVRMRGLRAVDIVDDPAANPSGLFHREQEIAAEAESLAAYALGVSPERPQSAEQFGLDPDRAAAFVSSFLKRHGLAIVPATQEEGDMPEDQKPETEPTEKPADAPQETAPETEQSPAEAPEETPASEPTTPAEPSLGAKFLSAFGAQGGVWFAEGKTFDEASKLFAQAQAGELAEYKKQLAELRSQLAALRGESAPVAFDAEPSDEQKAAAAKVNQLGSQGLAAYAASLKIKSK